MRYRDYFVRTLRETPAEVDTVSHRLLVKAGMVHQVAAGVYGYLPLAWRALRKIEAIIREEMDRAGGQEAYMPALQPAELWEESGRATAFGQTLFSLRDRRDRRLVLGPTHEEVMTLVVRDRIRSYRDLPLLIYHIQTKFRDEPRPRGGLIRTREFHMKDLYSFDADWEGLDVSYQKMVQAYRRIYQRCGLPAVLVEADSGAIGGKDSHEFMVLAEAGENELLMCSNCDYAANVERAEARLAEPAPQAQLAVEEVATPGVTSIEALSSYLSIAPAQTLKAVFYSADGEVVFVVIRGDIGVNEVKLKNSLKATELRLATEEEVAAAGLCAGYASPLGVNSVKTVGDRSILLGANFVAGANKPDTHLRNVNYGREFTVDCLADIALARAGDLCPRCGHALRLARGIEVGHVFKLGVGLSEKLGASYLSREGEQKPIVMGSYGIGLGRLLSAAIEYGHDDKGIVWPPGIAPFDVHICVLGVDDPAVAGRADALYDALHAAGLEVLYDDRTETAGVKLNDADLLGMPVRALVSARSLASDCVELKRRRDKQPELVPLTKAVERIRALLAE